MEARTAGEWLFVTRRPEGAQQTKLFVRRGMDGEERVLVDPEAMRTADRHFAMNWWTASPDGSKVAYGISANGAEQTDLHVIETATGRVLPDRIPRTDFGIVAWTADGRGLFYNQVGREGQNPQETGYNDNSKVYLHRLGRPVSEDVQVLGAGLIPDMPIAAAQIPGVNTVPGSRWAYAKIENGVAPEAAIYVAELADLEAGRRSWRRIADFSDQVSGVALRGDELWLLTFKDAARWKVLHLRLDGAATVLNAATVVPEGERVITQIHAAADGLYLLDMDGGPNRLRRLDAQGRIHEVAFEDEGFIGDVHADPREPGLLAFSETKARPTRLFRVRDDRAEATTLAPQPSYRTDHLQQSRTFATARDGTRVPVTLLHRRGRGPGSGAPVLVDAYGAYGASQELYFSPRHAAWADHGGIYAVAHVRGGGEYGRPWHVAAQKASKPTTWRDVIDVCEHLIRERWATEGKVAITGASAGGITVGMAMTERPDLFAAVVAHVGAHNVARIAQMPGGSLNYPEFGDPANAAEYRGLVAMDSYLAVRDGVRLPPALFTTGMTDPRVPPWLIAKMAARVQAAKADGDRTPALLRVTFDAGHGIGSNRDQGDQIAADTYAFVLQHAGDPRFQARA